MSFRGRWSLVTAGHVLEEQLDFNIQKKKIKLRQCVIADYFGIGAKVDMPTIIDYEDMAKLYIDNREWGLDFGLIALRKFTELVLRLTALCRSLKRTGRRKTTWNLNTTDCWVFQTT